MVESTESEFLAIERPKRVKNPGEKLYTPLVQSSEVKYYLQVKIFEFYLSGPKCQGGTLQCHYQWCIKFLSTIFPFWCWKYRIGIFGRRAIKISKKSWKETSHTTGTKFRRAGVALCRVQGATLHQWCVKFLSRICYPFGPPYSRKFRSVLSTGVRPVGTFDQGATKSHIRYFRLVVRSMGGVTLKMYAITHRLDLKILFWVGAQVGRRQFFASPFQGGWPKSCFWPSKSAKTAESPVRAVFSPSILPKFFRVPLVCTLQVAFMILHSTESEDRRRRVPIAASRFAAGESCRGPSYLKKLTLPSAKARSPSGSVPSGRTRSSRLKKRYTTPSILFISRFGFFFPPALQQ